MGGIHVQLHALTSPIHEGEYGRIKLAYCARDSKNRKEYYLQADQRLT
jgi:hypothetical protein